MDPTRTGRRRGQPRDLIWPSGTRSGALCSSLFLLTVSCMVHDFWKTEGAAKQGEMIDFRKNLPLPGALWALAAFPSPRPYSGELKRGS